MNKKIYQIYYRENQFNLLDPNFIPYNNAGKDYPFNFEYAVFFDLFARTDWEQTALLGTVSWKFNQKTGLSGSNFHQFVDENPGLDVYFVNPFPELCVYRSVWIHGDEFHKDLSKLTADLLNVCGLDVKLLDIETPPNLTAYCNYWVANWAFWEAYMKFLKPLWQYILANENQLTDKIKGNADPFINAPYLPFIFERLFSTFMASQSFSVGSVPINPLKIRQNNYLAFNASRINHISSLNRHGEIRKLDKFLIQLFGFFRKVRHYFLPLLLRKFGLRRSRN